MSAASAFARSKCVAFEKLQKRMRELARDEGMLQDA